EYQEQRIATLSQKPKPKPRFEFFFCVVCSGLFAGKPAPTGTARFFRLAVNLWERACPRRGQNIHHTWHKYRAALAADGEPVGAGLPAKRPEHPPHLPLVLRRSCG
ncbi:hypothetical protein, partial [Pseudomonas sp. xss_2]|uniref:hypothetical protein n=1 Tax=Pseudomonas sp. xss_2 TaxID=3367215 RepID=UPI00370BC84E